MRKLTVFTGTALLSAALLLSGCSGLFEDGAKSVLPAAKRPSALQATAEELCQKYTGYGFKALKTEAEQKLYAGIDESANRLQSEEFISDKLENVQQVNDIIELYKDDRPDVFWIDEAQPYYYANDIYGLTVSLHFKLEGEELSAAKEALENKISEVVSAAPADGSDYDKELFVHDWLIEHCVYDSEAVEMHKNEKVRSNEQNAYGALVEGRAVCEGYARAFQLLCDRLGVTCWVIQGQAEDFGTEGNVNHIWNCVQLEGNWYHVDVTWDDYEEAPAEADRYYYFNLTTEMLEKDHIISPLYSETEDDNVWLNGYVPPCDSTEFYYFTRNAMHIDDLNADGYADYLAARAAENASCCSFTVSEDLDFETTFNEMVGGYAYEWLMGANEKNNYEPQISGSCKLSANNERRVITFILNYE